jgi:hypothetical protein
MKFEGILPRFMRLVFATRSVALLIFVGSTVAAYADVSVNRFVLLGFPSPGAPWSGAEYETAARLLSAKDTPIPVLDGSDGEQVFSRMVDLENVRLARNASARGVRLNDSLLRQQAIGMIFKRYSAELLSGAPVRRELPRIISLMVHSAVVLNEDVDSFVPTFKHDDQFEVRMASVSRVKQGIEVICSAMEIGIGEESGFTPEDRLMLLSSMSECLPKFRTALTVGFRAELAEKLRGRVAEFTAPRDVALVEGMIAELERPLPAARS